MKYRIIGALVFLGLLILLPAVLREKPAAAETAATARINAFMFIYLLLLESEAIIPQCTLNSAANYRWI